MTRFLTQYKRSPIHPYLVTGCLGCRKLETTRSNLLTINQTPPGVSTRLRPGLEIVREVDIPPFIALPHYLCLVLVAVWRTYRAQRCKLTQAPILISYPELDDRFLR